MAWRRVASVSPQRFDKRRTITMNKRVLPGFGLSLGFTLVYLSLLILLPLSGLLFKASSLSFGQFWILLLARARSPPIASRSARRHWPPPSMPCSVSSSPGCWCAIPSPASVWSMRWWICPSRYQQRRRHHAGHALRQQRLDRPSSRAGRDQGGLHAARHRCCAHLSSACRSYARYSR